MIKVTLPIDKIFKTVEDVKNQCNFIELVLPGHLKSLEAVGTADKHITNGTFDRLSSEEFLKVKDSLGNLDVTLDDGGTNTAWINNVKIKVSFK